MYVPQQVEDGPRDDQIEIVGLKIGPMAVGDDQRDFIFDPKQQREFVDAVHTYAVIRQIMTMYQRALWRIGREKPLTWQWGAGMPLQVFPKAGSSWNGCYSRREQSLKFFCYKKKGKIIFSNRSYDILAHETGHAILDTLRPRYWVSWQPQTGALHEAFADITSILSLLSQLDQCEAVLAYSKANLHNKTFFKYFADDHGDDDRGKQGLAKADNDFTLLDVPDEAIYELSQVFTGAFYDILADVFEESRNSQMKDDALTLYEAGEHMNVLLVEALLRGPPQNATFRDIALKMITLEKNRAWKDIIKGHFQSREVLGKECVKPPSKPVELSWKKCRCCLSSKEHLREVEDAMKKQQSCLLFTLY
jgi:hypothetical protein